MNIWKRNCPQCNKEFTYTRKTRWEKACKKNIVCKICREQPIWKRACPKCNKEVTYANKFQRDRAIKRNLPCTSCTRIGRFTGSENSFFGKSHTENTKEKIRQFFELHPQIKSADTIKKMSAASAGSNNPMFKKTVYDVWIEKCGKEEADRKMVLLREKRRINSSGKNNPMFGKPSPQGSGNGWSGWYNDFFFRSLRELSYVVNVLERDGKHWKSAESVKIPYRDWDGCSRTYRPDFIVDEMEMVEIKPIKLQKSVTVQLKCEAAKEYCAGINMTFNIVDPPMLSGDEIKAMRNSGKIRFTKRYEERFVKNYG